MQILIHEIEPGRIMKNTSILRVAYLAGAVADFTIGLLMIAFPSVCLKLYGIDTALSPELRFWVVYAGIPIFAWTGFLIWGSRRPGERNFVAIPTVCVALGFVIAEVVGILFDIFSAINMAPLLAMQLILIALLLTGYRKA